MPYRQLEENKVEEAKIGLDAPAKQYLVRRSKKLPYWLWIAIAHSLGIRKKATDRPILATILYCLTVASALGFVVSTVTYVVSSSLNSRTQGQYQVRSNSSTSDNDVTDGLVMISITAFWCLLGLYANNLAYRLYSSAKFLDMVRLHAKTILKMNAAFVFFLLITAFVAVNNAKSYNIWYNAPSICHKAGISWIICQSRFICQCIFSIFAVLWHSLVGIVLLSVCRTNTMGIRRFIEDLEKESQIYERQRFGPNTSLSELMWLAENDADLSSEGEDQPKIRRRYTATSTVSVLSHKDTEQITNGSDHENNHKSAEELNQEVRNDIEMLTVSPATFNCTPGPSPIIEQPKEEPKPMSNAVVLQRYWKLSCATRMSSLTFQRWTTSVTTLSMLWIAISFVQWLSMTPNSLEVSQVLVPLLILPLLCAAYAEVNVEGKRLLKCICPLEERLTALYVMWQSPPQMTVFGVAITYSTMGTVAAGLLLALATRVVFKQLGVNAN